MNPFILALDRALQSVSGAAPSFRSSPAAALPIEQDEALDDAAKATSASLMRVNHAGEIAAQALYQGQALFARDADMRAQLNEAAEEELDHLAWTRDRVAQLGARTSLLDPLWYGGAFAIGALAGALGDKVSLGFLQVTEEQVEAHLEGHLSALPEADHASRAIVMQMKMDEAEHAQTAKNLGAMRLPLPVQGLMKLSAKVMTTLAAKI